MLDVWIKCLANIWNKFQRQQNAQVPKWTCFCFIHIAGFDQIKEKKADHIGSMIFLLLI